MASSFHFYGTHWLELTAHSKFTGLVFHDSSALLCFPLLEALTTFLVALVERMNTGHPNVANPG